MPALRPMAAMLAAASVSAFAPVSAQARTSPSPMVDKINHVRQAYGVPPVRYSRSLSGSSSRFARYLARTQRFAHGSPIHASGRFSRLGEILALMRGWKIQRDLTLWYWMNSPSHRSVLLSPNFSYIGAARVPGYFAGSPTVFWTVQFGRR